MSKTKRKFYSFKKFYDRLIKAKPHIISIVKVDRFPSFSRFKKKCHSNGFYGKHFYIEDGMFVFCEFIEERGIKLTGNKKSEIYACIADPENFKKKIKTKQKPLSRIQKKVQIQNENLQKRDLDGLLGKTVIRPKDYSSKKWGNYSIRTVKKR